MIKSRPWRRRSGAGDPEAAREPAAPSAPADSPAPVESPDDLIRAGRLLEAIDALTAANRRHRDARLEARIVDLRHRAFGELPRPDSPPQWEEDVADLFPGEVIPEIEGKDLSAENLRSAIRHHGSLLVRGLVPPADAERLVADIDHVYDAFDARQEQRDVGDDAAWFRPFALDGNPGSRKFLRQTGGILAVDSPRAMFDLVEIFEQARIGAVARDYFGERPALLAKKWTLRKVPHDTPMTSDWHQDGAFMGKSIRSLNVWLSLSHCGDDAPGLDIVGRRLEEIVETGTDGAFLKWTVGPGAAERVAQGTMVRPIFEVGDALLFDHMNLHRTAVDAGMTRDRYAIEAWFIAPSTYSLMTNSTETRDPAIRSDQIPLVYSTALR